MNATLDIEEYEHSLANLLAGICVVDPELDMQINGIQADSREITAGNLFIAYPGLSSDGRKYIDAAIKAGAVAVLAEANAENHNNLELRQKTTPIFYAKNIHQQLGKIAARFYSHPSRKMQVVGVTGTNGKTSCTHYMAELWDLCEKSSAVIGTIGYGKPNSLIKTGYTTPDAISLQQTLAKLHNNGVEYLAMEVSSHALDQGRSKSVEFDAAVFTNLSQDHLDYHKSMQAYGEAKILLFKQFGLRYAILNYDDPFSQQIAKAILPTVKILFFSLHDSNADVYLTDLQCDAKGCNGLLHSPWGEGQLQIPLLGDFNMSNVLASVTTLAALGVDLKILLTAATKLTNPDGRMQTINIYGKPTVIVDFAHTPDALGNLLATTKTLTNGKLVCIFGCGGGRDQSKRMLMGEQAAKYADEIIITNDNPRDESPAVISKDIEQGLNGFANYQVIHDRAAAIEAAITKSNADDLIVIAGKGHETTQTIGSEVREFSDIRVVGDLLAR